MLWKKDIDDTQGVKVTYPIIADEDRSVSTLYGMIHPNADSTLTVRSVFIIAPDKTVKLTLTYPASTGRNFDELLRVIDSLQLTAYEKVATPANWKSGDRVVIVPSVSDEAATESILKDLRPSDLTCAWLIYRSDSVVLVFRFPCAFLRSVSHDAEGNVFSKYCW